MNEMHVIGFVWGIMYFVLVVGVPKLTMIIEVLMLGFVTLYDSFRDLVIQSFYEAFDQVIAPNLLACVSSVILMAGVVLAMIPRTIIASALLASILLVCCVGPVAWIVDFTRWELSLLPLVFWSPTRHARGACCSMAVLFCIVALFAVFIHGVLCHDRSHSARSKSYNHYGYRRRRQLRKAQWDISTEPACMFLPVLCVSILGAWLGPVFMAWLNALSSQPADRLDEVLVCLTEPKLQYLSPNLLRFSTRKLLSRTRQMIPIHEPKKSYAIRATFHDGVLFALDNYTLFSAQHNKIDEILVYIVKKPNKLSALLRNDMALYSSYFDVDIVYEESPDLARLQLQPEMHPRALSHPQARHLQAKATAMRIPAEAFPTSRHAQPMDQERERELCGSVVLVADRIMKPRERLVELLANRHPDLGVQDPPEDVPRSYACVRVPLKNEAVARQAIKALGRERGKSSINIKALSETLVFDSPRD